MQIHTVLDQIDLGSMALPEFQRGYVWNREQVRSLMASLYRRHPVGSLLVWVTKTETAEVRGDGSLNPGSVKLLLDGQQRITCLYGIIRGTPPRFFEGDPRTFTGLHFNLDEESFEFYSPQKMKDSPIWINVTQVMQEGVGASIQRLMAIPELQSNTQAYINRLTAIDGIKAVDLHIEEVTGGGKTVDVVVDIFNRVNSGGTKLSKGDLALARICAEWPDARREIRACLSRWEKAGYYFKMEWLLRNVNTILTGEAMFSALKDVDAEAFQTGLTQAEKSCNYLLNLVSGRLGLDHDRVLGGRYAFPVMSRYLVQHGGKLENAQQQAKLLYWYVHSMLWGRFTGSTESAMNQDLALLKKQDGALDRLIEQLRLTRGHLKTRPEDFGGWSRGARFYPLLYLLTRVGEARDWGSGLPLSASMLGKQCQLHVHHIFPKTQLYKRKFKRPEVNAIANFCFLTQDSNLQIGSKLPEQYFVEIEEQYPGALASQWVPMDRGLWRIENYGDFLEARRRLLADAANAFFDGLLEGTAPAVAAATPTDELVAEAVPGEVVSEEEERTLQECNNWVVSLGLPRGDCPHELADPATGEAQAILDLAWPDGLQEGYSQPVALLLDEGKETEEAANRAGFRYFTDVDSFKRYVQREILAVEADEVSNATPADVNTPEQTTQAPVHAAIYAELKRVARAGQTTTYAGIAPLARLDMGKAADRAEIGHLLGEISQYEHDHGRPMLSAVVILQEWNMPGQGFFTLARELGLHPRAEDIEFFSNELNRVHQAWKSLPADPVDQNARGG